MSKAGDRLVWIPEAPKYPRVYAPKKYKAGEFTATSNPREAMQFNTREECVVWCAANPAPVFEPQSHSFSDLTSISD